MALEWAYIPVSSEDLLQALTEGLLKARHDTESSLEWLRVNRPRHPGCKGGAPYTDAEWSIAVEQKENYIRLLDEKIHDFETFPVRSLRAMADDLERAVQTTWKVASPMEAT